MIDLNLINIEDPKIRAALEVIKGVLNSSDLVGAKLRHVVINVNGAVTGHNVSHNLGYVPTDVIITGLTGSGTVTWNYDKFTKDALNLTTSGPAQIRALIGRIGQ